MRPSPAAPSGRRRRPDGRPELRARALHRFEAAGALIDAPVALAGDEQRRHVDRAAGEQLQLRRQPRRRGRRDTTAARPGIRCGRTRRCRPRSSSSVSHLQAAICAADGISAATCSGHALVRDPSRSSAAASPTRSACSPRAGTACWPSSPRSSCGSRRAGTRARPAAACHMFSLASRVV